MKEVIIKPRFSEKTFSQSEADVYVFEVSKTANKKEIKSAVEASYQVTVLAVRTLRQNGKKARSFKMSQAGRKPKRRQTVIGRRPSYKKAYVTLKKGQVIPAWANFLESNSFNQDQF